ncbi:MAG: hypothetical protein K2L59_06090 [Muribaculaceae bacterium]|nr:hypothetical protein [Muribaculaceae bacterium]
MIKPLYQSAVALAALSLLTGCIDDSYDLSDVDTTTRVNINDLVIPVNIDPVTLGDVISIDPDSKIQTVSIGGKDFYALVQKGNFSSEPIAIAGVTASPTTVNPSHETLERLIDTGQSVSRRAPGESYIFPIREVGDYFSYSSLNVDDAIVSLSHVTTAPFRFTLDLEIDDPTSSIISMSFLDMVIRAPKGLDAEPSVGTYDPASGYWRVPRVDVTGNHASAVLVATGIDTSAAGVVIRPDRTLDFNSEFHIESGYVDIVPSGGVFRNEAELTVYYGLDEFEIRDFDGEVRYSLDGIHIAPVSLADIPDFLKGDETEIAIANPQIYFSMNNPVAGIPLECSTGLRLTAGRIGAPDLVYDLDSPVKIGYAKGESGPYNFVLSPSDSGLDVPSEFASGLEWCRFSSLGSLLKTPSGWSVRGLPDNISIDLVDAGIPVQRVSGFSIPAQLPAADGRYELLAPLALNDGSRIVYTDVRDGWNDEDLDAITITKLEVTAHAVNNCPVDIQLTLYPITTDGDVSGVRLESNTVKAGSETDLVISMTGEVRHLDGIRIVAVLEAGAGEEPLAPSQTLQLDDIRARVTGFYEKEF